MKNTSTLFICLSLFSLVSFIGCESENDLSVAGISPATSNGTNSSYARLLTVGNFIYAVNLNELITFDATDPTDPIEIDRQTIGEGIETLFQLDGILLIGSNEGTFTYTIESTGIPRRRGQFDYNTLALPVLPCDPVVAAGDVAYATLYTQLEGQGPCGRDELVSLIVVMDITDLDNPILISTRETASPRGLAVKDGYLFVCNEFAGLTVYDVSDPSNLLEVSKVDVLAYDVIVKEDVLIVVGGSELIQYDYSDPENLVRLSSIRMK